jgi:hypothetical protein
MATISNYPDGVDTAGPTIALLVDLPIDYQVETFRYEDGGVDVNVQPCGVRRWQLEYEGLSAADVTTLRTHFNLAKGKVNDFIFYHRHDDQQYVQVRYESWRGGRHLKTWSNVVSVVLVQLA